MGVEYGNQLTGELRSIREKLGLEVSHPAGSAQSDKKPSSRDIAVGKIVHITRRIDRFEDEIDGRVIANTPLAFTVQIPFEIEDSLTRQWRVRYYFGASVWEFDVNLIKCKGDILDFEHSKNIRFINRRKFLRVSVERPGFIAAFSI